MAAGTRTTDERRTGGFLALLILLMIVIGGVGMTVMAKTRWWLPPVASAHGGDIDRLFYITLIVTGLVFVLVHVLLALFVWQNAAWGDRRAEHWHEHQTLELSYTIIPAIVLAILVSMGGVVWHRVHAAPPASALAVDLRGEQFAWLARYPGADGAFGRIDPAKIDARTNPMGIDPGDPAGSDDIVTRELHLVVNRPVEVRLRARDVLHSFFVPAFRVKQDVVPGMTVTTWFTPTKAGDYEIACAELCGVGHYIMRGKIKVETQEAFDAWLAGQKK